MYDSQLERICRLRPELYVSSEDSDDYGYGYDTGGHAALPGHVLPYPQQDELQLQITDADTWDQERGAGDSLTP